MKRKPNKKTWKFVNLNSEKRLCGQSEGARDRGPVIFLNVISASE